MPRRVRGELRRGEELVEECRVSSGWVRTAELVEECRVSRRARSELGMGEDIVEELGVSRRGRSEPGTNEE